MLLGLGNLMESKLFVVGEVLVTFGAVVVLVRILLVALHVLVRVERLVTVLVSALDAPERLEWRRHIGLWFA